MAEQDLDQIHIRDLALRAVIGVNDDERREKQDVTINITLHADLRAAGRSDDLRDTVDYKAIKQRVRAFVEDSSFYLVERLADGIAAVCLDDARVRTVRVRVAKPGALRFARSVEIDITRGRSPAR